MKSHLFDFKSQSIISMNRLLNYRSLLQMRPIKETILWIGSAPILYSKHEEQSDFWEFSKVILKSQNSQKALLRILKSQIAPFFLKQIAPFFLRKEQYYSILPHTMIVEIISKISRLVRISTTLLLCVFVSLSIFLLDNLYDHCVR